MKALTISQPFASLIADGHKWIENRTWPTSYRGPLAIHAGKGTQYLTRKELKDVPHGCILATAELVACVRLSEIRDRNEIAARRHHKVAGTDRTWSEAERHKHAEGPWCWILDNVTKLESPIDATGAQGLWSWESPLVSSS